MVTAAELRKLFLDFFRGKGHEIVESSSLVPADDPTLLFTNAGMNQFKNIFLGLETPEYKRAASIQKCIRASGKHNDLEDVGKDGRHHTFFEMLGNWSFGDYYKKEAIEWAWEFITERMGLTPDSLWVSVYGDDAEAWEAWAGGIGVPADRIIRLGDIKNGDEENFWSMGETGPCGPCSEIHYDCRQAPERDFHEGSATGQIVELWNLVFIQFNREPDGSMKPLPQRHVDTGMGLERACAVLQGVASNYDTDLFIPLFKKLEEVAGVSPLGEKQLVSFRVITDHVRGLAFAIADGALPSNEGRGYVLRRILRRAVRHGKLLGVSEPFLFRLVEPLVSVMKDQYHELIKKQSIITGIIRAEEELFLKTLDRGLEEFAKAVRELQARGERTLPGAEAFLLHDTYGFPLDLTAIMAEEEGLHVDTGGFNEEMSAQRERSQKVHSQKLRAQKAGAQKGSELAAGFEQGEWEVLREETKTVFTGNEFTTLGDMKLMKFRKAGDELHLVFDRTPFYGESGGQIGDTGVIEAEGVRVRITDAKKAGDLIIHIGAHESGRIGDLAYRGIVDAERRNRIKANHTATHLLHYALRKTLGSHVTQAGSIVLPERLRFDFNHYEPLSEEEIKEIELAVNSAVLGDIPVKIYENLPMEKARAMGAMALFGEKYGKRVRVVQVDGLSAELCGGTHVNRTGEIGLCKIIKESGISAGVRRIEAVTHLSSLELLQKREKLVGEIAQLLRTGVEDIPEKVERLQKRAQELEKELKSARRRKAEEAFDPEKNAVRAGRFNAVLLKLSGHTQEELREISDRVKAKLVMGVALIASSGEGRVSYVLSTTEDAIKSGIHCGNLLQSLLKEFGGRGGGRPHLGQGTCQDPEKTDEIFEKLKDKLEKI